MNDMHQTELRIARKVVRNALGAGYSVSVCDGEDYPVRRSTRFAEITAALASTDVDILVIRRSTGDPVGRIALVWGNGEDLVSDWSDNPETDALVRFVLE